MDGLRRRRRRRSEEGGRKEGGQTFLKDFGEQRRDTQKTNLTSVEARLKSCRFSQFPHPAAEMISVILKTLF